jgi:hypothetical protein
VPAANPAGKFATIWVLDDDTRVNVAESSFTTGAPVAVRLAPVMVICFVAEFTMALTIVGVCAWAITAEQISQATAISNLRIVSIGLVSSISGLSLLRRLRAGMADLRDARLALCPNSSGWM